MIFLNVFLISVIFTYLKFLEPNFIFWVFYVKDVLKLNNN